ncbi:mitochondrial carrier [Schizopora paradoxa]|uniref:Mitochondrial carrier n=1 Tax=Schizopora paradoxa TaxID=27342 RepID=A0A0H2RRH3_9AGAM|nr:mitochondrial carrier [Schizopora paradoxa]
MSSNNSSPSPSSSRDKESSSTSGTSSPSSTSTKPKQPFLSPQVSSYFIAGGVAGAASRTVVSPLERLKIIQQIQPPSTDNQYRGVWKSLVRMWKEEGFRGFMRGNGINCIRIIPYSAVQFTTYEQLKKGLVSYTGKPLDTPTRLLSGALAGITSVCSTYPLDLVRSRLSIATASIGHFTANAAPQPSRATAPTSSAPPSATLSRLPLSSAYHSSSISSQSATNSSKSTSHIWDFITKPRSHLTMWGMTQKVMREEGGFLALYRGLPATAFGVAPYVGINFAAYEGLRGVLTPPGNNSVARKLSCGALAGSISQTITYPCDVLRRKMQVAGMSALGVRYTGAIDALKGILRTEGPLGLYKGLWPNLLKVAPSIATSFFTYELVKEFLIPPEPTVTSSS